MEPIFFNPVYKEVIWGGNNLAKILKRDIKGNNIGESWEISAHPNGLSKFQNSEIKEDNLLDLFNNKSLRKEIFGTHCENMQSFPILAKFIDANNSLSIQVHPDDEYARKYENDSGKTEVWYIIDCKENAKLIYGFKDSVTKENLKQAIDNIEENVRYVTVHKGDFIPIPAGTIHAIMDGIVLCEIQQSSDITYRVYDWNRVDKNGNPRELHKEKALDVIKLGNKNEVQNFDNITANTKMYRSDIFNIDMLNIKGKIGEKSNEESFFAYIVIDGEGSIKASEFEHGLKIGDTFMVPATLGEYEISGDLKMMKVWV